MKIAITAEGTELDAKLDPRFGRCAYFIFYDQEGDSYEAVKNENAAASGGAGVSSGQFVADRGAKVVITGRIGPKALRTLQAAGISIFTGATGTVADALEQYRKGNLKEEV